MITLSRVLASTSDIPRIAQIYMQRTTYVVTILRSFVTSSGGVPTRTVVKIHAGLAHLLRLRSVCLLPQFIAWRSGGPAKCMGFPEFPGRLLEQRSKGKKAVCYDFHCQIKSSHNLCFQDIR